MRKAAVVAAVTIGLAVACGGSSAVKLVPGERTPAAGGRVDAWRVEGGNTRVMIDVEGLPQPGEVVPGTTAWVVWVQGLKKEHTATNVGVLRVDESKSGILETLTPLTDFGLFITAEESGTVAEPHGNAVLSTQVHAR